MMTALATVSAVEKQGAHYHVQLSCEQQTSCSSCSSQKSCGTGIVTKAVGNKSLFWQLTTKNLVKAGQIVEIGFPERSLLESAALVYLVPLFMMMLGAAFGQLLLAAFTWSRGGRSYSVCCYIYSWWYCPCKTFGQTNGRQIEAASGVDSNPW